MSSRRRGSHHPEQTAPERTDAGADAGEDRRAEARAGERTAEHALRGRGLRGTGRGRYLRATKTASPERDGILASELLPRSCLLRVVEFQLGIEQSLVVASLHAAIVQQLIGAGVTCGV